jgi:hypothetical protein
MDKEKTNPDGHFTPENQQDEVLPKDNQEIHLGHVVCIKDNTISTIHFGDCSMMNQITFNL